MLTCKICQSFKIENKELSLCATHNREQRKARPEKAKIKPIAPISDKMKERIKRKKEAAAEAAKQRNLTGVCETCMVSRFFVCPSHTLSTKQFRHLEDDPNNIIFECYTCHNMYEHNKPLFAVTYPEAWKAKIKYIKSVHPEYLHLM